MLDVAQVLKARGLQHHVAADRVTVEQFQQAVLAQGFASDAQRMCARCNYKHHRRIPPTWTRRKGPTNVTPSRARAPAKNSKQRQATHH